MQFLADHGLPGQVPFYQTLVRRLDKVTSASTKTASVFRNHLQNRHIYQAHHPREVARDSLRQATSTLLRARCAPIRPHSRTTNSPDYPSHRTTTTSHVTTAPNHLQAPYRKTASSVGRQRGHLSPGNLKKLPSRPRLVQGPKHNIDRHNRPSRADTTLMRASLSARDLSRPCWHAHPSLAEARYQTPIRQQAHLD